MINKNNILISAILCAGLFTAAQAQDEGELIYSEREGRLSQTSEGFHYFNKPGADIDIHDADLLDCIQAQRFLDQPSQNAGTGGGGLLGAVAAGIGQGIANGRLNRRGIAANIENCMIVKGWRVIGIDKLMGNQLDDLKNPELRPYIEKWVGLENPAGPVLREPFKNDLYSGFTDFYLAKKAGESSLSVRSYLHILKEEISAYYGLNEQPKTENPRADRPFKDSKRKRSQWSPILKATELSSADPDGTYLVLRVKGANSRGKRTGPRFIRLNKQGTAHALDGQPSVTFATARRTSFKKNRDTKEFDSTFVYEIAPGTWSLAAITKNIGDLAHMSLCLGAPTFEVAKGDVIYAGTMILPVTGGFPINADDLTVAKQILANNPALADRVQRVNYTSNGQRLVCSGAYLYAYEIPDIPFQEGYEWGSKAKVSLLADARGDDNSKVDGVTEGVNESGVAEPLEGIGEDAATQSEAVEKSVSKTDIIDPYELQRSLPSQPANTNWSNPDFDNPGFDNDDGDIVELENSLEDGGIESVDASSKIDSLLTEDGAPEQPASTALSTSEVIDPEVSDLDIIDPYELQKTLPTFSLVPEENEGTP